MQSEATGPEASAAVGAALAERGTDSPGSVSLHCLELAASSNARPWQQSDAIILGLVHFRQRTSHVVKWCEDAQLLSAIQCISAYCSAHLMTLQISFMLRMLAGHVWLPEEYLIVHTFGQNNIPQPAHTVHICPVHLCKDGFSAQAQSKTRKTSCVQCSGGCCAKLS